MFHPHGKKQKIVVKPTSELVAMITPSAFLKDEKRESLLEKLREASFLKPARFDDLCLSLIYQLIDYAQELPETVNRYYHGSGGLIDHALNRTEAAMALFRECLAREIDSSTPPSEEESLWQYVLTSASLLVGIGKLAIEFLVNTHDEKGISLGEWNPLIKPLSASGKYYGYEFLEASSQVFRAHLNVVFAMRLMPKQGFEWIAQNKEALRIWLLLLEEDFEGAETLGAILDRADALAISRYFLDIPPPFLRLERPIAFGGSLPDPLASAQQVCAEFWRWLQNMLKSENGKFILNKGPIFMIPGGLLMLPETFRWFMRDHPKYKSLEAIQHAFTSVGIHDAEKGEHYRAVEPNGKKILTGFRIKNASFLLPDEVLVERSKGKTESVRTLDLMAERGGFSMRVLNAKGNWEEKSALSAPSSGMKHRG